MDNVKSMEDFNQAEYIEMIKLKTDGELEVLWQETATMIYANTQASWQTISKEEEEYYRNIALQWQRKQELITIEFSRRYA